jgi:SAM-dependent methyltransferase
MNNEAKKEAVRKRYGAIARENSSCCCGGKSCCEKTDAERIGSRLGYSREQMKAVPEGSNLGLGCGNPSALAGMSEGETVVDLGSGAGFDCFLAAGLVGSSGRVIGVDMTPDMLSRARRRAEEGNYGNVEFRLGEIEHLPIADLTADLVISNCVINLSPEKEAVFAEAFRILKPGGRMMISDIVLKGELPQDVTESESAYSACIAGAITQEHYVELIRDAGFEAIEVLSEIPFSSEVDVPEGIVVSISMAAYKPLPKSAAPRY